MEYKWKKIKKDVFFDGHERKDMIEYKKSFLDKIKSLLPYLVRFSEDESMLPKEYSDDCVVDGLNERPIIMITYDENTFSINDGCQKIWILNDQVVFQPKRKGKEIIK